jgi:ferrous iron transport protein B
MQTYFDGQAGAFAYLLFILLYAPCVAAIAALYREVQLGWTLFIVSWTTGVAYMTATIFYQAATFTQHPDYSLSWIAGLVLFFVVTILGFRIWGVHQDKASAGNTSEINNDFV